MEDPPDGADREFFEEEEPEEWYDYVGYFFTGTLAVISLPFLGIIGDYWIEFLLGFAIVGLVTTIFGTIAWCLGLLYLLAWFFEEMGWVDDNYVDSIFNIFVFEWYKSLFEVDWIRIPFIFLEY